MIWPRDAAETVTTTTAFPVWTPEYTQSTAATDYSDQNENEDDDDNDNDDNEDDQGAAWSQSPSPAWEADGLAESPYIPSAQPVFYPFSQPASGIGPLTPPSPVRQHLEAGDAWVSDFDADSEAQDMLDDILQGVSDITL